MNKAVSSMHTAAKPSSIDWQARCEQFRHLEDLVLDIQRASYVLDELLEFEIKAGFDGKGDMFPCKLNRQQIAGITYMSTHVRDLGWALKAKFEAAERDGSSQ